jgi:hypothetical protein
LVLSQGTSQKWINWSKATKSKIFPIKPQL